MEYQSNSNHNSNSAPFTTSNGSTGSIASNPASGSENRKPASPQQLVRENVQYLIEQLEVGHSEALTAYLEAMAHFTNYSLNNILLIARQRPGSQRVAGIYVWNELGRRVKRGEKGIAILAPMIGVSRKAKQVADTSGNDTDSQNTPMLLGFRKVYVWAEEQTEGEPLATLSEVTGEVGEYLDRLREFVFSQDIELEYSEKIAPALGASYGGKIRILPGQSQPEEFTCLVHETAHELLMHKSRRTTTTKTVRETEAEAVAFVVAKAIGLSSQQSAEYIQLYNGSASLLLESLEVVQQTAAVILSALKAEESVSQEVPEAAEAQPDAKTVRRSRTQAATTEAAA